MGVWEFLTKQRGVGSAAFRWKEPLLFRIRIRGDVLQRLAIMLAVWGLATGVFLVLFAINVKPPGIPLALGLGAAFGLGPAWIATFFLHGHTSGRVTVGNEGLRRQRHYASFSAQWMEWMDWPYDSIRRCVIVPGENSGHPFSVMLVSDGDDREIVAAPSSIDLVKLEKHLASRGVAVTHGKAIPQEFTKPVAPVIVIVIAAIGAVAFVAGLAFYLVNVR